MHGRSNLAFASQAAAQIRDQICLVNLDVEEQESQALKARFAAILHSAQSALDRLEAEEQRNLAASEPLSVV
jgi:hypothetical protein